MPLHRKIDPCFETNNTKTFNFSNKAYTLRLNEIRDKTIFNCLSKDIEADTILTISPDRNSDKVIVSYLVFTNVNNIENITINPAELTQIIWVDKCELKSGKNYIIMLKQINRTTILASLTNNTLNNGSTQPSPLNYAVLLKLRTTNSNETVYYTDENDDVDLSGVKLYWDYDGDELGPAGTNKKTYTEPGEHYLVVMSDDNLKFPFHTYSDGKGGDKQDISKHLIEISRYQTLPLKGLNAEYTESGGMFYGYNLLECIKDTDSDDTTLFNTSIYNFSNCFRDCKNLKSVSSHWIYRQDVNKLNFESCFQGCSSLERIPGMNRMHLSAELNYAHAFQDCTSLSIFHTGSDPLFLLSSYSANLDYCFCGCTGIIDNLPNYWNIIEYDYTNYCFCGCVNAINYDRVPVNWKCGASKAKYAVLLTVETTGKGEAVSYNNGNTVSNYDTLEIYWDYISPDNLGHSSRENTHTYLSKGEHKILIVSDTDLQFPSHYNVTSFNDISTKLIKIDKFGEIDTCKPLLIKGYANKAFYGYNKLKEINSNEIFYNCTNFTSCFQDCAALESISDKLFGEYESSNFTSCFQGCTMLESIPNDLFEIYDNSIFDYCFQGCENITGNVPELWKGNNSGAYCYCGCDNASNYNQIPSSWKCGILNYGIILTVKTSVSNEYVYYTNTGDSTLSNIEIYWEYKEDEQSEGSDQNKHLYNTPGEHKILIMSNSDLQFPSHSFSTETEFNDISNHLISIDSYNTCNPLLIKDTGNHSADKAFYNYTELEKINISGIFESTITSFNNCFENCEKLELIPNDLYN